MEISNYIILTDQQLVTLAHDGDAVAFETLFNRYRDGIYKLYLNRTGGNRDDADDLLQETLLNCGYASPPFSSKFCPQTPSLASPFNL